LERIKQLTAPADSDSETEIISLDGEDDYVPPEEEPKDDDEPEEIAPKRKNVRRTKNPKNIKEENIDVPQNEEEPFDEEVDRPNGTSAYAMEVADGLDDPDMFG
jgi:hypothetical protein